MNPNRLTIVTGPKLDQLKDVYFGSEAGLRGHFSRMDTKIYEELVESEQRTRVMFRNGSKIIAEVPEPATIRGLGPDDIEIEEYNFIEKDKELWLSALLPMTLTKKVDINVNSTPWNKDSIYYQMRYDKAFNMFSGNVFHDIPGYDPDKPDGRRSKYHKTWRDLLAPNGPLLLSQVEIMKAQYNNEPWRWTREMESEFVDDQSAFIPSSLIQKCVNSRTSYYDFTDSPEGLFSVGWDLGRDIDPAAVAVVRKIDDVLKLVFVRRYPLGTPHKEVRTDIQSLVQRWQYINRVVYDHTGTKGMDEEINTDGFPGLTEMNFTAPSKHGMATTLKDLMMTCRRSDMNKRPEEQRRRFEMPYDLQVENQLNLEQYEILKGSELYRFYHPDGTHDDLFWAICMAVYGLMARREIDGPGAYFPQ